MKHLSMLSTYSSDGKAAPLALQIQQVLSFHISRLVTKNPIHEIEQTFPSPTKHTQINYKYYFQSLKQNQIAVLQGT